MSTFFNTMYLKQILNIYNKIMLVFWKSKIHFMLTIHKGENSLLKYMIATFYCNIKLEM